MNGLQFRDRTEEEDQLNTRHSDGLNVVQQAQQALVNTNPALAVGVYLSSPRGMGEQVTNYRYGRYRDNTRGERLAREHVYDQANDEVFRITGTRLSNPERDDVFDPLSLSGTGADRYATTVTDPRLRWHAELAQMAAGDPRLAEVFARYGDHAAIDGLSRQVREEVTRDYHAFLGDGGPTDQLIRGVIGAPGMIVGGLSSGSPEQIAQLAAGGSGKGMNLVGRAVTGALANMVGQAAVEPALIEDARRMGEEYPQSQVLLDFLIAGGFGATVDLAGGVVDRAGAPPVERATDAPLRERVTLPPSEADVTAEAPGGEVQRALSGQAESLVLSAYSRDAAAARTFPDPDLVDPIALADEITAAERFINGETDAYPVESRPTRNADPETIDAARRAADDAPAPPQGTRETIRFNGQERPRTFMRFDPRELGADAQTFQYKRSEGGDGLTGVLDGVEVFDPASAGKVKVFEYADGRRVIADGHQRRALARAALQAGQENVWLDGYLYREADGWTPREVRNLAAQKNLRETPGDPIDTVQLIREAPELIDSSVPQRSGGFRIANGLAKLSDEAFRAVRAGVIDPRLAAPIGEIASARPELHEPLVRLFQEQQPRTVREAAFIVHEAMQAEVFKTQAAQLSMFGDAPELSGMRDRAEILRIAGNQLRADRRIFETAERNADALERAGNIIRKEENARRADLADALLRNLDVLATRPSAVSRLLREIADNAAAEKVKPDVAAARFVNGLVDLLNERGLVGLLQERAPDINPPKPINDPILPRLQEDARAADLLNAHDADDEAFRQSLAEVAVERAMAGNIADMPEPDAIGHTPEADLARIEAALDALGVDDHTVPDVAAALYARPTPDMEAEARARLRTDGATEAPATIAEAVEQGATVEVWNPYEFEDADKLFAAIDAATLPQLEKIQRTFGAYGTGEGSRTRAEFKKAFLQEWRDTNGMYALGPTGARNTVADVIRRVQREFPRHGKKLLERGRLEVVQSVDELLRRIWGRPDAGAGYFAFAGVRSPEARLKIADAFEHVRTSEMEGIFSDFYAWRSTDGRPMAVELLSRDPRMSSIVSFGELTPGGIRMNVADVGVGNALETISNALAVLERDARDFKRPAYRFAGLTGVHKNVYRRMFASIDPPVGYRKIEVLAPNGNHAAIAVVRDDVADKLGLDPGGAYQADKLMGLERTGTATPRSQALADKQNALAARMGEDLAALMERAKTPPRAGAFAMGRGVIGYSEGGKAWIVADNLPPELVRGITLHEVGVHVGMQEMLGEEGFAKLLDEVRRLHEAGDRDIVAGQNTARFRRVPDSQLWEETLAYAITYADESDMSDGFRGFMMRVLNSVRAWAWKNLPFTRSLDNGLTFEDMQFLALGALRHAASTQPRTIDVRSIPARLRDALRPRPRVLAEAVAESGSGWLPTRVYHGRSGRPRLGTMFTTPNAKIAGLYGEIEAYEVRGPIFDASDDLVRTQDDFNRIVREARKSGATGVYIRALDRGEFGAQEQIVMFDMQAVRPAGSGRVDPNNPASVAAAEAERLDNVVSMLEHCR